MHNIHHNTYTHTQCITQNIYVHTLQQNRYACHDTMTTHTHDTVPHVHNTTCTQHHMYNMYTTHVQHVQRRNIAHPETTLYLPNNLASSVFPMPYCVHPQPKSLVCGSFHSPCLSHHIANHITFIPLMYPSTSPVENINIDIIIST